MNGSSLVSSGAAIIDQSVMWLSAWVSSRPRSGILNGSRNVGLLAIRGSFEVTPPAPRLPMSNMSGSFHRPGPAYSAKRRLVRAIPRTPTQPQAKVSKMSGVVRHSDAPSPGAHSHGRRSPHSHTLNTIDRPQPASASAMVA